MCIICFIRLQIYDIMFINTNKIIIGLGFVCLKQEISGFRLHIYEHRGVCFGLVINGTAHYDQNSRSFAVVDVAFFVPIYATSANSVQRLVVVFFTAKTQRTQRKQVSKRRLTRESLSEQFHRINFQKLFPWKCLIVNKICFFWIKFIFKSHYPFFCP